MERLTDRKTAADLKANVESLQALGLEPNMSDLRYIKLAEYENREERERSERYLNYEKPKLYFCDPVKRPMCEKTMCFMHGGCCKLTDQKEFAQTDENGNAIEYKEGD